MFWVNIFTFISLLHIRTSGLHIAEESLDNIQDFLITLQRQAIEMEGGYEVIYKEESYEFIPTFLDRSVVNFVIRSSWLF